MTWRMVFWTVGVGWLGVGVALVVLFVWVELSNAPPSRIRQRMLRVLLALPLVAPLFILLWPFAMIVGPVVVWRESVLQEACHRAVIPEFYPDPELTEDAWLGGRNAADLVRRLGPLVTKRQHRLIAAACCRRVWPALG